MATIEARGYVSKPETKATAGGKTYVKYRLGVKQKERAYKDKPESVTWANFDVVDYKSSSPPSETAYVTIKGYLKVREYEHNGVKRTALEINAQEVEVSEAFAGSDAAEPPAPKGPAKAPAGKEPWDD